MRKPFQEVLHPPELKGLERRRYWIAAACWLPCVLMCMWGSYYLLVGAFSWIYGDGFTKGNEAGNVVLWSSLALVGTCVFLGDYLWTKIFVSSGYLSNSTVIRLRTNRAPTAKGERIHRKLSLSLGILIPAFIAGLSWYVEQYWLIPLAMIFGLWLFVSLLGGWRRSDAIVEGREAYSKSEADRVLLGLERRGDKGHKSGP